MDGLKDGEMVGEAEGGAVSSKVIDGVGAGA
jgi:hypothetical protein